MEKRVGGGREATWACEGPGSAGPGGLMQTLVFTQSEVRSPCRVGAKEG